MRAVFALGLVGCFVGCFNPTAHSGQPCTNWCPPPESCIAGRCGGGPSDDGGTDGPIVVPGNYMFVTSTKRQLAELGSFAAADAWCQELADAVPLPGTFVAWTTNAYYRMFTRNPRGWYRTDGRPFADKLDDFATSIKILYPPRLTEYGADLAMINDLAVATGTFDGREDVIGGDCGSFTLPTGTNLIAGYADGGAGHWMTGGDLNCSESVRLYCFGIDKNVAVTVPPVTNHRVAFVSPSRPLGTSLADLDARCTADAALGALPGTFKAWVATSTASAQSRLPSGPDWKRVDDVVALSGDGMTWTAPIEVDTLGTHRYGTIWTGAMTPQNLGSLTCTNWTSNSAAATGVVGMVGRGVSPEAFFQNITPPVCTNQFYIYCLEQ